MDDLMLFRYLSYLLGTDDFSCRYKRNGRSNPSTTQVREQDPLKKPDTGNTKTN